MAEKNIKIFQYGSKLQKYCSIFSIKEYIVAYNNKTRLHLDSIDYFLLSALAGSLLIHQLHPELWEEAKMLRLKRDLINKSRLGKHPIPTKLFFNPLRSKLKVTKVYKVLIDKQLLLDKRGGDFDPNSNIYILLYKFLSKFEAVILKILAGLKNKKLYAHASKAFAKQVFYCQVRRAIQLFLEVYNIQINQKLSKEIGPELIATAIFTGGATGIISACLPVLRSVLGPSVLFSTFLFKKLIENATSSSFWSEKNPIRQILKDEEIDQQLNNLLMRSQEEFSNSGKVRLQDLHWNKNPQIKEAAQRLNVFQTAPEVGHKLTLDPCNLDPDLKRLFQELGIGERPNRIPSVRSKGKIVYFRDVIRSTKVEEILGFRSARD